MSPPDTPEPDTPETPPDDDAAAGHDAPGKGGRRRRRLGLGRAVRGAVATLLMVTCLAALGAAGLGYWGWRVHTGPGPLAEATTVVVPSGAGLGAIAGRLAEAGAIERPLVFVAAARLTGEHAALRAGEYAFEAGVSQRAVLAKLTAGETVDRFVTVPEGLTTAQVLDRLRAEPALEGAIESVPPEGALLPETYHFERGDTRAELVARMRAAMRETLEELWAGRAEGLPFEAPHEAVTLASIVEKETGVAGERAKVAGVFVNRLERGMRLQSDPTVVYALTGGQRELDRALTRRDWEVEHPYNTYRNAGLPPGPIANPGRAALAAVLDPAATDALYFVADGSGGHAFAETLEQHNRNVREWRAFKRGRAAREALPEAPESPDDGGGGGAGAAPGDTPDGAADDPDDP